jgi:hypothetical protein
MRDNSARIQPNVENDSDAIAVPAAAEQKPDLFSFAAPTEFVFLPSKGKYYPEDHPLSGKEEVEIRYMTAKDEDILTSQALIKKGVVLDRLVGNVLIDKRIKPSSLLLGDKNAIMVAARITGFGAEYSTKFYCSHCREAVTQTFDLGELGEREEPDFDELGIQEEGDGRFSFKLPKTGATVEVKLLTGRDESEISKFLAKEKRRGKDVGALTTQLRSIITSVNGISNRAQIHYFVENLPFPDSRHIREMHSQVTPSLNMSQEISCSNCATDQEVELPMAVEFFWPKQ